MVYIFIFHPAVGCYVDTGPATGPRGPGSGPVSSTRFGVNVSLSRMFLVTREPRCQGPWGDTGSTYARAHSSTWLGHRVRDLGGGRGWAGVGSQVVGGKLSPRDFMGQELPVKAWRAEGGHEVSSYKNTVAPLPGSPPGLCCPWPGLQRCRLGGG